MSYLKLINRIIGTTVASTLIFLLIYTELTDYRFYGLWIPVCLFLASILSIFIDWFLGVKTKKGGIIAAIVFTIVFIPLLLITGLFKPFLDLKNLHLLPHTTYQNQDFEIIGRKVLMDSHTNYDQFTLYSFKWNHTLIKAEESVEGNWNESNPIVTFPKSHIQLNLQNHQIKPF